jgi:hypothetical protein
MGNHNKMEEEGELRLPWQMRGCGGWRQSIGTFDTSMNSIDRRTDCQVVKL